MYEELYQYFIHHNQLQVPGIGTFRLERNPAVADFPNKVILPPTYNIRLHHDNSLPSKGFFSWLGETLRISDRDAVIRFNNFAFGLKQDILAGDKIKWDGIGILTAGLAGEIRFESAIKDADLNAPEVRAEKILRENVEHNVRVGEDQKTSVEMREYFTQTTSRRSNWWVWAIALGLLIVMFLGWYFSTQGFDLDSLGNRNKIKSTGH